MKIGFTFPCTQLALILGLLAGFRDVTEDSKALREGVATWTDE